MHPAQWHIWGTSRLIVGDAGIDPGLQWALWSCHIVSFINSVQGDPVRPGNCPASPWTSPASLVLVSGSCPQQVLRRPVASPHSLSCGRCPLPSPRMEAVRPLCTPATSLVVGASPTALGHFVTVCSTASCQSCFRPESVLSAEPCFFCEYFLSF